MKEWRLKNLEKQLLYEKNYRDSHKEKRKEWEVNNIERIKESKRKYQQKYRKRNPEAKNFWRIENIEKVREYSNNYQKKKREIDPLYKFRQNLKTLIGGSFKRRNSIKSKKTEEILGCTISEFVDYILSKCPEGITLNDFGKKGYHIDHIIPISTADSEGKILELCHYSNLQPLWWKDNMIKSNKII